MIEGPEVSTLSLDRASDSQDTLVTQWNERIHVRVSSASTSNSVSIFEYTCPKDWGVGRHLHVSADEIIELRAGRLAVWLPDATAVLHPGDTVVLPHGVPHAWTSCGDTAPQMIVTVTRGDLESFFRKMALLQLRPDDMDEIIKEAEQIGGMKVAGPPLTSDEVARILSSGAAS